MLEAINLSQQLKRVFPNGYVSIEASVMVYEDGRYSFSWELLIKELNLVEKYDTFEQVKKRAAQLIADKAEQILTVNGILEKGGM